MNTCKACGSQLCDNVVFDEESIKINGDDSISFNVVDLNRCLKCMQEKNELLCMMSSSNCCKTKSYGQ